METPVRTIASLPVTLRQVLDALLNGPSHYTVSHHFSNGQTILFVIGALIIELVFAYVVVLGLFTFLENVPALFSALLRTLGVGKQEAPHSFLELTFPATTTKSAFATEQLHILLRGMVKYQGFWDNLAARKKPYSLEFVGTNDEGIRFVICIPAAEVETVRRNLLSFLPGLKVREIEDYVPVISDEQVSVVELKLNADYVLPLHDHKALEEHDLMAFLGGHMTKLLPGELVAYQIVCLPVFNNTNHRVMRHVRSISARIALGKEIQSKLEVQRTPLGYALWLLWFPPLWFIMAVAQCIAGIGEVIASILSSDHELPSFMQSGKDKRNPDNPYDQEMRQSIKSKLDQQLNEVTVRVLVASADQGTRHSRINALIEAFRPFRSSNQSIGVRRHAPLLSPKRKNLSLFKQRVLSPHHLTQQTVLSSSELSDLYHFPNTNLVQTEGLVKSRSQELPAPLSIRRSTADLDVVMGINRHGGEAQAVGLNLEQRRKHAYIIGKTGTGKTTLLTSAIYQDIVAGKGLAMLDAHGDMFRELLCIVPEHRRNDVVVFDPSDREYPLGLNILDPGIPFANDEDRKEWIASSVVSVFEKLADKSQWGPRMEHNLTNAVLTALQLPHPNLYTVQRLLTEKSYQRQVAKGLKDPVLKQFWSKEFKLMGNMQLSNAVSPLTHRLGKFITHTRSRHILLQEKTTLRISEIMDEGKILLVNLSKGDIGEDQSEFFGTILTSLIWMAAYQRTKIAERDRRDFFVYIDEFQNFATQRFAEIASEGRKFRVSLTVSHQNVAQIEDKAILQVMAGNAHSLICLKASPDDETFILPFMQPEVTKGDIVNLAPHHFYMKTTADESEEAFSGETVPLFVTGSDEVAQEVVASSRKAYGTPLRTIEKQMETLLAEPKKPQQRSSGKDKKTKPEKPDDTPQPPEDNHPKGVHGA